MPLELASTSFGFSAGSYLPVLRRTGNGKTEHQEFTFWTAVQSTNALNMFKDLTYERRLGGGSSFVVNLYRDNSAHETRREPATRRYVAVKSAKAPDFCESTQSDRDYQLYCILLEIQILVHHPLLMHPNIIDILGYDWKQGPGLMPLPVVVVEYADLGELSHYLQSHASEIALDLKERFCLDIALGIQMLHSCGIAHGDVKLPNILVVSGENARPIAKISDFGHAITGFEAAERSSYLGTSGYIPPETKDHARLSLKDFYKCDVFAYGLVVWEILNDGTSYIIHDGDKKTSIPVQSVNQPSLLELERLSERFLNRIFPKPRALMHEKLFYADIFKKTILEGADTRYDMNQLVKLFNEK